MPHLPCIEIEPNSPATASVIWLHGLGADGNDFAPIIPELRLPESLAIRFIFPNAPSIPVTINNGYVMPAWYDILEMNIERKFDSQQLLESSQAITDLIKRENQRGIPCERIILAGFSQGGAVCYQTALSHPEPLAGLLSLSTYFATANSIEPNPANNDLNIQIFHGLQDPVVPVELAEKAYQQLSSQGYPTHYQTFSMQHELCYEEIEAISTWFQQRLTHPNEADQSK